MADKKKEFKQYRPGKLCPKCHSRMGEHRDRISCGRCGYTEFSKHEKKQ